MTRMTIAKYGAFCRVAAAQARHQRGELYARVLFFAIILGVFSSLWRAVGEAGMPVGADSSALIWYLATTEWIVLSAPLLHIEIQEAVRRGDIVYQLGRPVSYLGAAFAEGLGLLAVRAPLLGATGVVCAFALTRSLPRPGLVLYMVLFGLVASALLTAMSLWIGLLAFWLEDVSPVFWVWQKLAFVLGGLMLPIELYPEAMQRAAALTPFPTLLAGPASFALPQAASSPGALALGLATWSAAIACALWCVFRRARTMMSFNGG
jgi:ABC-2 type transport system permease protein